MMMSSAGALAVERSMSRRGDEQQLPELKGGELRVSVDPTEMVQFLVESGQCKEVPATFVQPLEKRPSQTRAKVIPSHVCIPVVDMANYNSQRGGADDQRVVEEIGRACQEWGFFQVINHGIPESLMQAAIQMCHEFFALPIEEKERYCMKTSSGIGYGRRFAVKEGVRVDWVDRLGFWSSTEQHRNRDPLHVSKPAGFNDVVAKYGDEILKLSHIILAALSRHSNLPDDYILQRVQETKPGGVRTGMNYYPPCPQPDLVMGLSSHADGSVVTIVQQDGVSGLEVLKDEMWVPVPPVPNALVINIGDQIQMISNEKYKSVVHRALASNGRMSIANFFLPDWETVVRPAPQFCSDANPPRYRPVTYAEYITEFMKVPLGGKRFTDNYKLVAAPQSSLNPS